MYSKNRFEYLYLRSNDANKTHDMKSIISQESNVNILQQTHFLNLLIFRTDVKTNKKVNVLRPILNNHISIINWSIDIQDIDNILRIETDGNLVEQEIIDLLKSCDFYCEILTH